MIIDVGIERGEMTARAGRDPAPERRALETLREMTKREPVRLELRLQRRPESAGLDARGARGLVDFEHAAKLAQIDRYRPLVPRRIAVWLNPADDARSAAERCHARLRISGPVEHRRDLLLIARIGNHVRRVAVVTDKPAYIIGE